MKGKVVLVVAGALLCVGCGCSRNGPFDVAGAVTFNGEPVSDGAVYFIAPDSDTVVGFGKITGGRYSALVARGRSRVRITGDRRVPGKTNENGSPLIEQYIPPRFNEQTELEATIEGSRRLDWRLSAP